MKTDVKKISVESFEQGEKILKSQLNDNYKIIAVESKRKWVLVGPKLCQISYMDLNDVNAISVTSKKLTTSSSDVLSDDSNFPTNVEISDLRYKELSNEVKDMKDDVKDMMESMMKEVGVVLQKADRNSNDALIYVEDVLLGNGILPDIAESILKDAVRLLPKKQKNPSKSTVLLAVKEVLERTLKVKEGYNLDKTKIIMLVGPTGVGKTTTIAKLASKFYANNKEVGMITLDTYRLGAVTQLSEYSSILSCPMAACDTIDDLQDKILAYMGKDCVLIDTTGQNQKNIEFDDSFRDMVDTVNPDQLALVLSATTKTEDMMDCIDRFAILDLNSLIITKVDETNSWGSIVNIAYKYPKLKISYFTNGQDVPDDIEPAKCEKVIKAILGNNE